MGPVSWLVLCQIIWAITPEQDMLMVQLDDLQCVCLTKQKKFPFVWS